MDNTMHHQSDLLTEKEMELLLSLSSDFVSVRNTNDLLEVITRSIKDLIGFNHIHICRVNADGKTFTSYVPDTLSTSQEYPLYQDAKKMKLAIDDNFADKSFYSPDPVCFNLENLRNDAAFPMHFTIVYETGIRQVVIMRLSKANKVFGFWFLFFRHLNPIDIKSLKLIKGVSHQISSAVSNIISIEDIKKREEEKTRILAFSNTIASGMDKEALSKIIKTQLAELFGIKDFCFFLITKDKTKRMAFLFDPDALFAKHTSFTKMKGQSFDNTDGIYDKIIESEGLVVFDVAAWKKWTTPHPFMDVITAMDMKQMGGNMVRIGQEDIGIMTFSHDNIVEMNQHFRLYESICSQLAVAASNLYNLEKITKKEEETARLLEFSNAIASVRDKSILGKIIHKQLSEIFGISNYCIWINSRDKQKRIPFLFDNSEEVANHPLFAKSLSEFNSTKDYIFNRCLQTNEIVLLDPSSWDGPDKPAYAYAEYANAFNFLGLGASRIDLADDDYAVIVFSHHDVTEIALSQRFYRSVCSQLSVAISNLIANEEIIEKQEEKTLLLS
jgi:transcriptional regulator with GAF, ATPase, and Fis domain